MGKAFEYHTTVRGEWIDYNGHMQDAFYGLIFSYAVDAVQEAVGVGADYRAATGCTIYLLEDHKYFLREVKEGTEVAVRTHVIGLWEKRFHLWMEMMESGTRVATAEMMELHVDQHPEPHGTPLPEDVRARLAEALLDTDQIAALPNRARTMGASYR